MQFDHYMHFTLEALQIISHLRFARFSMRSQVSTHRALYAEQSQIRVI